MSHAARLDKASNAFFLLSFIFSKIKLIPYTFIPVIASFISLCFSGLGYLMWLIASSLHPEEQYPTPQWHGFIPFRKQHIIASVFGLVASALSIAGLFIPIFFIPSIWIFLASNVTWTISEYHKMHNPPQDDPTYSNFRQSNYFVYAAVLTLMTLITTVASTLAFITPLAATTLLLMGTIINVAFGGVAAKCWFDFNYTSQAHAPQSSYSNMNLFGLFPAPKADLDEAPPAYSELFASESNECAELPLHQDACAP